MGIEYETIYQYDFAKHNFDIKVCGLDENNIILLDNILDNLDSYKVITYYKSKYNQYVSYDTEPPCLDGFYIEPVIRFKSQDDVMFFEYLLDKQVNNVNELERLLEYGIAVHE